MTSTKLFGGPQDRGHAIWQYIRVPNQPKTPMRSFRIPQELYESALGKARNNGTSLSEVIRDALASYVEDVESPTL